MQDRVLDVTTCNVRVLNWYWKLKHTDTAGLHPNGDGDEHNNALRTLYQCYQ